MFQKSPSLGEKSWRTLLIETLATANKVGFEKSESLWHFVCLTSMLNGPPKIRMDQMTRHIAKTRRPRRFQLTFMFHAVVIEGLAISAILFLFFGMRADLNRQAKAQMLSEPIGHREFASRLSVAQPRLSTPESSIAAPRFLKSDRMTEFSVSCSSK